VLLPERLHQLKQKQVVGPANLVVEVVSPGSQRQDRVEKYREYELGGVTEYWLIDLPRHEHSFFQLSDEGLYEAHDPDTNGIYHSRVLNRLLFPVDILWRETLPTIDETLDMFKTMLRET